MTINMELASFSDHAYRATMFLYLLALVFSLFYHSKVHVQQRVQENLKVALTGGGDIADSDFNSAKIKKNYARVMKLGTITQSLVWLAVAVHAVSLISRGIAAQRFPFGNLFEYVSLFCLWVMIIAAFLLHKDRYRVLWAWVLAPLCLLLFYGGTKLYAETAPVVPALQSFWLPVHISVVSFGASIGMLSGVFSLLYIIRRHASEVPENQGKVRGKLSSLSLVLPSEETLDSLAYRTAVWALPTLGLGIVFGAIWADVAWNRYWGWDPKETTSFITWILYAAYLHTRAIPALKERLAPWVNILALAMMIFNLFFINMVVSGLHSYAGLN